jgi:hypothetical protein
MKNIKYVVFVLLLTIVLMGCSSSKQESASVDNNTSVQQNNEVQGPDIKDKEKVAKFIIDNELKDGSTTQAFINDMYEFNFMDLNGDSKDEVVLIPQGWTNIFAVASYDGAYHTILKDERYPYDNKAEFADGFLKILRTGGGTGVKTESMNLYIWDGKLMKKVLSDIEVNYANVTLDGEIYETVSELKGPLTKFEYILTAKEGLEGSGGELAISIKEHRMYSWDQSGMKFNIQELSKEMPQKANSGNSSVTGNYPDNLFIFKGIKIGTAKQEVIRIMGQPQSTDEDIWGINVTSFQYNNYKHTINIDNSTQKVDSFVVDEVANGLKEGDSIGKVTQVMGKGQLLQNKEKLGEDTKILVFRKDKQHQINFTFIDEKLSSIMIGEVTIYE